jgi:transposase
MVHIVSNLSEGKSYRKEKVLKCGHCGFEHDADINAAMNIAALGKSVSLPESLGMSCQLENYLCS